MPINIRSADAVAKKFAANGARAGADYTDGIKNPKRDQAEAAKAAAPAWEAGVQAAITRGAFEKGLDADAGAKYKRKAGGAVAARRFGEGVTEAAPDYQRGAGPYLDTLRAMDLGPRFPKGDPRNIARVEKVAMTLRAQKTGQAS